jgi:quercetin dioxygenase-like cupin family protein/uncharacterized membrane protein YphA (DoxX/SURF4 family)
MSLKWGRYSSVFLRIALGVAFLSAVADRFGWWGPFGEPNVDWGNFSRFLEYTHSINWFVPAELIPALGVIATAAEIVLGLLLLVGWHTRASALLSALLLLTFGVAMIVGLGVKAPLNYSVFTGVGGPAARKLPELPVQPGSTKEKTMNNKVLFLLLAFSSMLALRFSSGVLGFGAYAEKPTTLMTKDLPDVPGKEGMIETVDFAPGEVSQAHRHNADVFAYVLEGSIITQLKGGSPQTVSAGGVFYESPTDIHTVTRNGSDTLPAKLLVFYVKKKGAPEIMFLEEGKGNSSR